MEHTEIADRYLRALDLERRDPTLPYLADIVRRHVGVLPFSSVGPRLGDDLPLDPESLLDRIVVRRRGGYCFEQNGLLFAVLADLGFSVRLLLARVLRDGRDHPALTHRVTLVEVDGLPFIVDAGFGPLGPPEPVPLPDGPTEPGAAFRVMDAGSGELHMQRLDNAAYVSLYRFELARYGQSDCELGHFYSHRHPAATFVNNLVASRILDGEVRSLRNRDYVVMRPGGEAWSTIDDAPTLRSLLDLEFGIHVSETESRRLFESLPSVD